MNKPKVLQLAPDHKEQLDKLARSGMTPVVNKAYWGGGIRD